MSNESVAFGFSEFTTWPWPFSKDIERYRHHGASVIEICEFKLAYKDYACALSGLGDALRPSSVQMLVHSVFPDSMAPEPLDPCDRIAAMKRGIEQSAPYLPAGTPFIVITGAPPQRNIREAVDRTARALSELGDFAEERGMKIAFEPLSPATVHTDTAIWSLDDGLDLVEAVGHSSVGICIDTWNVWQTPKLEEAIRACRSRILVVQLSDWRTPRATADRYVLGDGVLPLAGMMRAIRSTGYEGPWVVEILSALHLPDSLWKSDLDDVLERNRRNFERLWKESEPDRIAVKGVATLERPDNSQTQTRPR